MTTEQTPVNAIKSAPFDPKLLEALEAAQKQSLFYGTPYVVYYHKTHQQWQTIAQEAWTQLSFDSFTFITKKAIIFPDYASFESIM